MKIGESIERTLENYGWNSKTIEVTHLIGEDTAVFIIKEVKGVPAKLEKPVGVLVMSEESV